MKPKSILNFKQKEQTGILDINGYIGPGDGFFQEDGIMSSDMEKELEKIDKANLTTLQVNIDSLGGDLKEGLAIYNLFSAYKKKKECVIKGWTASAATIISQAFDKVSIVSNALFLVHRAQQVAMGNIFNFEQIIEELKTVDKIILDIYRNRTKTKRNIEALMNENMGNGKWLDAKQALSYSFVDAIIEPQYINYIKNIEMINKYKLASVEDYQIAQIKKELKNLYNKTK